MLKILLLRTTPKILQNFFFANFKGFLFVKVYIFLEFNKSMKNETNIGFFQKFWGL